MQAYIDMVKIMQYSKFLNKVKTFIPYTVYFYRKTCKDEKKYPIYYCCLSVL